MKKTIFKKLYFDIGTFFITASFLMGLIVWTIQAVNFFDFVTEDGHGLEVYFKYTVLNFPKIISRIFPFIFFISLFYILLNYKKKNEINIFWIHGISKLDFLKKLFILSIYIAILQIFLNCYLTPLSQLKGRDLLKNSNIDFFTALFKKGKFLNTVKNITIFIEDQNPDGSFNNIFLEDERNENSKIIYAKKGIIIETTNNKKFRLFEGKVINNKNDKLSIFNFDEIDFNFVGVNSKTIIVPKIQERGTFVLLNCIYNFEIDLSEKFICDENIKTEVKRELFKRIYKPIFIPIITIICCFLILDNDNNVSFKNTSVIFISNIFIITLSEILLRYFGTTIFNSIIIFIIPILILIFSYYLFKNKLTYV